jgi:hypothetical protein
MKQANEEWKTINSRIRTCLRHAARKCLEDEQITANEYDDFFMSGNARRNLC